MSKKNKEAAYKFNPSLIRKRREQLGWGCNRLALETSKCNPGVSAMTCHRIELSEASPNVNSLLAICKALSISPRSLFIKTVK